MEFQGSSTTKDVDVQEFWRTTQGQPVWEPPRLPQGDGTQQLKTAAKTKPPWNSALPMQEPEFYREQLRKLRAEPAAIEPMLTRKQYLATPSARLGYVLPPGYERHMQIQRDGEARDAGAEQRSKVSRVLRGKYERQAQHAAAQARREQLEASIGTRKLAPADAGAAAASASEAAHAEDAELVTPRTGADDADESADELEAFDATHAPTLAFDPAPPRASPTLDTSRSEPVMTTAVAHTFEVTLSRAHEDPPPLYG